MEVILMESEAYKKIMSKISSIEEKLHDNKQEEFLDSYVESDKVRQKLGVCKKTWQNWKDAKLYEYTQIGRKIYIAKAEFLRLMQEHSIKRG